MTVPILCTVSTILLILEGNGVSGHYEARSRGVTAAPAWHSTRGRRCPGRLNRTCPGCTLQRNVIAPMYFETPSSISSGERRGLSDRLGCTKLREC